MNAEPTNADRRFRASEGLRHYKKLLRECGDLDKSTLIDLLTDLMHLSDKNPNFPFAESLAAAERNHSAEVAEESKDREYP